MSPGPASQARLRLGIKSPATPGSATPELFLVLMVGLPGTGKSTLSRRLAVMLGAAVLESDALRQRLFPRPRYDARENGVVFRILHAAARAQLAAGVPVIVDATNLDERARRPLYDIADEVSAKLEVVCLEAPLGEVERRLEGRRAGADPLDRSTADLSVYERMAESYERPTRPHRTIDTSDPAATEAALGAIAASLGRRPGGRVGLEESA